MGLPSLAAATEDEHGIAAVAVAASGAAEQLLDVAAASEAVETTMMTSC